MASKKRVRQARTECINSIVKKIRKAEQLLEKDPENVKNKDKLRKSEQVLEELKVGFLLTTVEPPITRGMPGWIIVMLGHPSILSVKIRLSNTFKRL